jgi:hypothetical protein
VIRDTVTRSNRPAITSDHWHVVRARWAGDESDDPEFTRSIVSEHPDRNSAVAAARELRASIDVTLGARPSAQRDQVFVRKPAFKSFRSAKRVQKQRRQS